MRQIPKSAHVADAVRFCVQPRWVPAFPTPRCRRSTQVSRLLRLLRLPPPQVTKKVTSPLPTTDNIFYAGTGMLLCRSEEKVALFDVQQRSVVAELATPPVKYAVWSSDMSRVALLR